MRDLPTFNTCPYGHPLEWREDLQHDICPTCEEAVSKWLVELIERAETVNPDPAPVIEGPGFVMIGRPFNPPVQEHPARYVLLGILGALTVFVLAGFAVYIGLLPMFKL
jgi:hypothetical protein